MIKVGEKKIKQLDINEEMVTAAMINAKRLGQLPGSIRRGKGNPSHFLGKDIFGQYVGIDGRGLHDLIVQGKKYKVKSKEVGGEPKLSYDCSVEAADIDTDCDYYVFTRILNTFDIGWILGYISREDFMEKSTFIKAGYYDKSNRWTASVDCYNIKILDINDVKNIRQL